MKKFAWLMFIMGKMKILNGREDITELAFLLFATIYCTIMLCPKDVTCELIESKSDCSRTHRLYILRLQKVESRA